MCCRPALEQRWLWMWQSRMSVITANCLLHLHTPPGWKAGERRSVTNMLYYLRWWHSVNCVQILSFYSTMLQVEGYKSALCTHVWYLAALLSLSNSLMYYHLVSEKINKLADGKVCYDTDKHKMFSTLNNKLILKVWQSFVVFVADNHTW